MSTPDLPRDCSDPARSAPAGSDLDALSTDRMTGESARVSRRAFVALAGGVLLGGCASGTRTRAPLPAPPWQLADGRPSPVPRPAATTPAAPAAPALAGVHARSAWAKGAPNARDLNRMTPVRAITIHHDAEYNTGRTAADSRARLESIRRYHRSLDWADIGYHYIVDRQGRVWEGRSLAYQGAHVKLMNEGNIGVMLLGNFEQQQPSRAQVAALQRHVTLLRRYFRVPESKVLTHREWPTASTLCPGRSLQTQVARLRTGHAFV